MVTNETEKAVALAEGHEARLDEILNVYWHELNERVLAGESEDDVYGDKCVSDADNAREVMHAWLCDHEDPQKVRIAAERIIQAEDKLTEVKEIQKALVKRAERKVSWLRTTLWPEVCRWASTKKRDGKTVHLPDTTVRITYRTNKGKLAIDDQASCISWIRRSVGIVQAIQSGMLRIKLEASATELNKHFEATGELPDGCAFEPPAEVPTLYRK